MSDDLRIPAVGFVPGGRAPISASYRARRAGPEPGLQRIKLAAAGLGGLLVLGMASWAVMGHRPAAVPLIEADSRPIRVKPDNPGGMQFAGSDEMAQGDHAGGGDRMAPGAENPAPQALRAQLPQSEPAAVPDSAAPVSARASVATEAAAPGTPVAPAMASPAAVAPSRPATGTLVQLGALGSEAAAQAEWQRLAKSLPELVNGRQPSIQRIERDGRIFWRLRTGGFSDVADATGFCAKLRAKGSSCAIASF